MKHLLSLPKAAVRAGLTGLALFAAGIAAHAQAAHQTASTSTVLARVNGTEITEAERSQIADRLIYQNLQMMGGNVAGLTEENINMLREQMRAEALNQAIRVELIGQAKKEVTISDEDINKEIKEIEDHLKSQNATLDQLLASRGMTEPELRVAVVDQLKIEKMVEARTGELDPTEEAMKKFYEEHKTELAEPPQLQVSHILIGFPGNPRDPSFAPPPDAEKAELKKKAEEALAKVKAGGDFAALAKEYSSCPSAQEGGDLGMGPRGRMVPAFEEASWNLEVGGVSDIVETQFGYHIIKATGKQGGGEPTFEEAKDRIEAHLIREKFESGIEEMIKDLEAKATIERLEPATPAAHDESTSHTHDHSH